MSWTAHRWGRPAAAWAAYVLVVGSLAALGFIGQTTWPILLAVLLTLPVSLLTTPGYYVVYGLLALLPGANPSSSSGSGASGADGSTVTGSGAIWFVATTEVIGVLALVAAAVLNVVLVRALWTRRRTAAQGALGGL